MDAVTRLQAVQTRARVMVHPLYIIGTEDGELASRWGYVAASTGHTRTQNVCPAASCRVIRPSMSVVAEQRRSVTESLQTARHRLLLSMFRQHNNRVTWFGLFTLIFLETCVSKVIVDLYSA